MNYYLDKLMIYHEVHQMERAGFSIQKIAEHLVMDWRTVKRLLLLSEEAYLQQLEAPLGRKCSLDAYEVRSGKAYPLSGYFCRPDARLAEGAQCKFSAR